MPALPRTESLPPHHSSLPSWSDAMRRRSFPALAALIASGALDEAEDLCRQPDETPPPGLFGPAATDPTDRRH